MQLTIGLSYAPESNPKYRNYWNAIEKAASALGHEVTIVDLSSDRKPVQELDGILFTGGADIDPARYGKQEETKLCGEIEEARDQLEFELADAVEQNAIPTLGICRGLQLLNVHRGGSLITDLQTFGARDHKKLSPEEDSTHTVSVTGNSYLSKILNKREGRINSAHHQAIERVGEGYIVSARAADDGTIEAIEWANMTGRPFFLAVQWHPERMDYDDAFSGRLFETFLWEAAAHKMLRGRIGSVNTTRAEEEIAASDASASSTTNGYHKHE